MQRICYLAAAMVVFTVCNFANAITYIGHSATFGQGLPTTGNARADNIASLTYIFTQDDYQAAANEQIKLTEVNLVNQDAGTITPFVAVYDGVGSLNAGSSYSLLVVGDSFDVTPNSLVNEAFLVGGANPMININAGDILVAGAFQSARNIVFANDATPGPTWIERNNAIPPSLGDTFAAAGNADFFFGSQHYRYNIGFELVTAVPEPTTATLGLIGLAGLIVRRRRAA